MPALLIWIIRLVGFAFVARRAMRGGRRMPNATTVRGRPGSLQFPELPFDLGGALREARNAMFEAIRATFWSLRGRDMFVLIAAGSIVVAGVALIANAR